MFRIAAKRQFDNSTHKRGADCNPSLTGLLIEWYDGLPSPLNSPWTDLEVRPTALTQPNRIETYFRHGYEPKRREEATSRSNASVFA